MLTRDEIKRSRLKWLKVTLISVLATGFVMSGVGLAFLFNKVNRAFNGQVETLPTRIYAAPYVLRALQPRSLIQDKISALKIPAHHLGSQIKFSTQEQNITLSFEDSAPNSLLASIQIVPTQGNGSTQTVGEFALPPEIVATLSASDSPFIRELLKRDAFPQDLQNAVVAAEDQHFFEHWGIDPKGFLRAIIVNLKSFSFTQGGSTITQQLVKNLLGRRDRNLYLKINELFLALLIELKYTKQEILERYLNEVYLGQIGRWEVRGFSEGARYFFSKPVGELNTGEIALLVGLIKGPGFYAPDKHLDRAKARQRYVIERLIELQKISPEQGKAALLAPLRLSPPPQTSNRAPYYVDAIRAEMQKALERDFNAQEIQDLGLQVYTTVNPTLSVNAQNKLDDILSKLPHAEALQGAFVILENKTGNVIALSGGRDYSKSNFNRFLNMKRQIGSLFKPVVVLTALKKGKSESGILFTQKTPISNAPVQWKPGPNQPLWQPKNYEKTPENWVNLDDVLARSLNIPTVRLAKEIGIGAIIDTARLLGLVSPLPEVPSLALGSAECGLLELAVSFSTLARSGNRIEPQLIHSINAPDGTPLFESTPRESQKIEPGLADLMTKILMRTFDPFGTAKRAKALGLTLQAAGKTGTTNDYRDAWFAGYTPEHTLVVWVGPDELSSQKPPSITGASHALPVWVGLAHLLEKMGAESQFRESEFLEPMNFDKNTGLQSTASCPESQKVSGYALKGQSSLPESCSPQTVGLE